jgi:hypothetical protein
MKGVAILALLVAVNAHFVFVERDHSISIPAGYSYVEKAPQDAPISLIIAVKQRNTEKLEVKKIY